MLSEQASATKPDPRVKQRTSARRQQQAKRSPRPKHSGMYDNDLKPHHFLYFTVHGNELTIHKTSHWTAMCKPVQEWIVMHQSQITRNPFEHFSNNSIRPAYTKFLIFKIRQWYFFRILWFKTLSSRNVNLFLYAHALSTPYTQKVFISTNYRLFR